MSRALKVGGSLALRGLARTMEAAERHHDLVAAIAVLLALTGVIAAA